MEAQYRPSLTDIWANAACDVCGLRRVKPWIFPSFRRRLTSDDDSYLKLSVCRRPDNARCRHPAAPPHRLPASPAAASSAHAARSRARAPAAPTPEGARRYPAFAPHRVPPRGRVRNLFGGNPLWSGYREGSWLAVSSDPLRGSLPLQWRDGVAGGACGRARRRHSGELVDPVCRVFADAAQLSVTDASLGDLEILILGVHSWFAHVTVVLCPMAASHLCAVLSSWKS
jgi:hypothetical protein